MRSEDLEDARKADEIVDECELQLQMRIDQWKERLSGEPPTLGLLEQQSLIVALLTGIVERCGCLETWAHEAREFRSPDKNVVADGQFLEEVRRLLRAPISELVGVLWEEATHGVDLYIPKCCPSECRLILSRSLARRK